MDEEVPLRRSLRVAGMTPLRPMNTIMLSEQQQRRVRTQSRSRSRTSTPKKPRDRDMGATRVAPDSRTRQLFNLPSDLSTSDFLGDTPTARFYHGKSLMGVSRGEMEMGMGMGMGMGEGGENLATVVARRTTGGLAAALGAPTVKARRVAKRPSNVFLAQEADNGMLGVAALGSFRVFSWIAACFHGVLLALFNAPLVLCKNVGLQRTRTILVAAIGGLSFCLILYAFLQLDTAIPPAEMSRPMSPRPAVASHPSVTQHRSSSKGEGEGEGEGEEGLLLNLDALRRRLATIEASLSQAKHLFDTPTLSPADVEQMERRLALLAQKETTLEGQVAEMVSSLNEVVAKVAKTAGGATDVTGLLEKVNSLSHGLQAAKADIIDLKDQLGLNVIRNSIRRELADVLPEHLLVKRNADGSVTVDPALIRTLNGLIVGRTVASSSAGNTTEATGPPPLAVDGESIENLLNGKLNQIQHQIVSREDIILMIANKIQTEMALFDELQRRAAEKLVHKLGTRQLELENKIGMEGMMRERLTEWIRGELATGRRGQRADDVGMADYALESMGSRPVLSRTSPSFVSVRGGWWGLLGVGSRAKPPSVALRPDNSLGHCWAFAGSRGFLTIALGVPVIPTHFSLEHVSESLQVDRSSAPRDFSVFGHGEMEEKPILLGQYEYALAREPVQTFATQYVLTRPVRFVRLVVDSNHGRDNYTCIYRFRVHSHAPMADVFGDSQ